MDDLLCEGSFNWLSAVDDIDHVANNLEVSVAISGLRAQSIIQTFAPTQMEPRRRERRVTTTAEENVPAAPVSVTEDLNFQIFPGARFGQSGYCVRIEGEYIRRRDGRIKYFKTEEQARKAIYTMLQ